MTDQAQTPAPQYFVLPKEVVQEVLNHLLSNPVTNLYAKVSQAQLFVPAPAAAPANDAGATTPSAN